MTLSLEVQTRLTREMATTADAYISGECEQISLRNFRHAYGLRGGAAEMYTGPPSFHVLSSSVAGRPVWECGSSFRRWFQRTVSINGIPREDLDHLND